MLRKKYDIKIIENSEPEFPHKLKMLKDCPKKLYYIGNVEALNEFMIAIVGARNCSFDSLKIAQSISKGVANLGITIVSGFATGIDSIAHLQSIKNNSKTIAVMGTGLDKIYPKQNRYMVEDIIENGGAIISEYELNSVVQPYFFNMRNRIIAGLADLVIVIEAKEKSGSLVTVNYAKKYNKPILVVPGKSDDEKYARK